MNDNLILRTIPGCPMAPEEIVEQQRVVSRVAAAVEHVDPEDIDEWERAALRTPAGP